MSDIGLRFFQQLKGIDSTASKDDYFNDKEHKWDIEALEQDLKIAQDRIHQNGNNIALIAQPQQQQQPVGVQSADIHHNIASIPTLSSSPIPMNNSISLAMPSLISENAISPSSDPLINTTATNVTPNASNETAETHNLPIITEQTTNDDDDNEDIDVDKNANSNSTTDIVDLSQMPSPNVSPSIDFDGASGQNVLSANANHGNVKKRGKKRKSEEPMIQSSSKKKKRRTNGNGNGHGMNGGSNWNDAALKKLYSLKRQVKHSDWFWEPVDEIKHSAPNYHLVCPLPSDYGTICRRLEQRQYTDLDALLRDCELVFVNARMYNAEVHNVHRASLILEKKFKELMHSFVTSHCKMYGSERTLECWKNGKEYKPFAVPLDD